jgi:hypothetical protein
MLPVEKPPATAGSLTACSTGCASMVAVDNAWREGPVCCRLPCYPNNLQPVDDRDSQYEEYLIHSIFYLEVFAMS